MVSKKNPITKIQFTRGRPKVDIPEGQNPFIDANDNKSNVPEELKDSQSTPSVDETKRERAILRARKKKRTQDAS